MRTVTFSNAGIREYLPNHFVCAWKNRKSGFHDCQVKTEADLFRNAPHAYPTMNICLFFLTPELQVLHYFAGYLGPDLFLEQARFALRVRETVFDVEFLPRNRAEELFAQAHVAQARELTGRVWSRVNLLDRLDTGVLEYRGKKHEKHGDSCNKELKSAYRYLRMVHYDLAGMTSELCSIDSPRRIPGSLCGVCHSRVDRVRRDAEKERGEARAVDGIPLLSEREGGYLYGDAFSEE
jgi:hypothetical protein